MSNTIIKVTPPPPQQLCPGKIELPKREVGEAALKAREQDG